MLEADLATQFNPEKLQIFIDAQKSCSKCEEELGNMQIEVVKGCLQEVTEQVTAANQSCKSDMNRENGTENNALETGEAPVDAPSTDKSDVPMDSIDFEGISK